jgi:predicted secreted protein
MAASTAEAAYGVILSYTTGPTVVGELTNIGGLALNADAIDVTSHDSDDAYREFVAGLLDGGEFSVEGNHIPADTGQQQILTHLNARDAEAMTIVYPDSSEWAFNALCTAYSAADAPVDGKLAFSATFKITGKPELTYE